MEVSGGNPANLLPLNMNITKPDGQPNLNEADTHSPSNIAPIMNPELEITAQVPSRPVVRPKGLHLARVMPWIWASEMAGELKKKIAIFPDIPDSQSKYGKPWDGVKQEWLNEIEAAAAGFGIRMAPQQRIVGKSQNDRGISVTYPEDLSKLTFGLTDVANKAVYARSVFSPLQSVLIDSVQKRFDELTGTLPKSVTHDRPVAIPLTDMAAFEDYKGYGRSYEITSITGKEEINAIVSEIMKSAMGKKETKFLIKFQALDESPFWNRPLVDVFCERINLVLNNFNLKVSNNLKVFLHDHVTFSSCAEVDSVPCFLASRPYSYFNSEIAGDSQKKSYKEGRDTFVQKTLFKSFAKCGINILPREAVAILTRPPYNMSSQDLLRVTDSKVKEFSQQKMGLLPLDARLKVSPGKISMVSAPLDSEPAASLWPTRKLMDDLKSIADQSEDSPWLTVCVQLLEDLGIADFPAEISDTHFNSILETFNQQIRTRLNFLVRKLCISASSGNMMVFDDIFNEIFDTMVFVKLCVPPISGKSASDFNDILLKTVWDGVLPGGSDV